MTRPPFSLSQTDIADRVGKDRTLINKYLSVAGLCDHPGGVNAFTPLSLNHLLELSRLSESHDQAILAEETAKKGLSVDQLKTLIDQKVGPKKDNKKVPGTKKKPMGVSGTEDTESTPDPLHAIWSELEVNPDNYPNGFWDVAYGSFKIGKEPEKGWTLHFTEGINPPAELAEWCRKAAEALAKLDQARKDKDAPQNAVVQQAVNAFQSAMEQVSTKDAKDVKTPAEWMAKVLPAYLRTAAQAQTQPFPPLPDRQAGLSPAASPMTDEEEQLKAAEEDAKKLGKLGRSL